MAGLPAVSALIFNVDGSGGEMRNSGAIAADASVTMRRRRARHRANLPASLSQFRRGRPLARRQPSLPFPAGRRRFAAGLAWLVPGERLVVSYGVDDRESWLGTLDADDVRAALESTP
jgi:hypothetical protein